MVQDWNPLTNFDVYYLSLSLLYSTNLKLLSDLNICTCYLHLYLCYMVHNWNPLSDLDIHISYLSLSHGNKLKSEIPSKIFICICYLLFVIAFVISWYKPEISNPLSDFDKCFLFAIAFGTILKSVTIFVTWYKLQSIIHCQILMFVFIIVTAFVTCYNLKAVIHLMCTWKM